MNIIVLKILSYKFFNLGWGFYDYCKYVFSLFYFIVDWDREIKVII